jgi:CheY-like chemotaxis protein
MEAAILRAVPTVVAFMDDLLFLSRIREAAKALNVEVRSARKVDQLVAAAAGSRLVLMDLDSTRLPTPEGLKALRSDPSLALVPVVGFFSHVHPERAQEARARGVVRVLPRSAFVQELPGLLGEISEGGGIGRAKDGSELSDISGDAARSEDR